MAVTSADLVARAPDLADVDTGLLDTCIAEAQEVIAADNWTAARYDLAVTYYALHLAALANLGSSAAGPVSSMTAGAMSRSYAVSGSASALDSTSWGREFQRLRAGNLTMALPIFLG